VKIDDRPGRAFKVLLDGAPYGIEAKAEFKCKKIDARLLTSNIRTIAVNRFEKGLPELKREARAHVQPPLADDWREPETTGGIEPGHGNAGYIINALWTAFEKLCLTYYTGPRKARLAVDIPLDSSGASVVALPLAEINEVTPRKRVKPRKKKVEEAKPDARPKRRIKLEAVEPVEEKRKKARNNGEDS
jgi:hypothetical protein